MSQEHTEQTRADEFERRLIARMDAEGWNDVPSGSLHDVARMAAVETFREMDHPAPSKDTIARISDIIVSTYNRYIPVETTPVIESEAPNVAREIDAAGLLAHTEPYEPRPTAERAQAAYDRAAELYPPHVAGAVRWSLGDGVMFDDAQAALIEEVLAARPVPSPGTTSEPDWSGHGPQTAEEKLERQRVYLSKHRNGCTGCEGPSNTYPPCWTDEQVSEDLEARHAAMRLAGVGASSGQPQPGDRVRLRVRPELLGTVTAVIDGLRIAVRWDNDRFASAADVLRVEVVERAPEQPGGEQ